MAAVTPFTDEQARALINMRMAYDAWLDAERGLRGLPYDLRRKTVGGRAYLYEISGREGTGRSLGRWDEAKAIQMAAYREEKQGLKQRSEGARARLDEVSRLARALRLPMLSSEAGSILREADSRGMLGSDLLVIGTSCMAAYAQEAAGFIAGAPDETEDFDLAWVAERASSDVLLWNALKAVDSTFTVNTERDFQARNAKAYEVELLVAPSRAHTLGKADKPRPVPLPEQEWLLLGTFVDQVVPCRDGSPARIVAPDPRWFALHKLWLAKKPARNPLKRPKDRKQGMALLNAVAEAMPQFPLDAAFAAAIPPELAEQWRDWHVQRSAAPSPRW